jgi:ubiquinol oxidase
MTTTTAHTDRVREQLRTLAAPRRRYGLAARSLFVLMDVLYGRKRRLEKFLVLELIAP